MEKVYISPRVEILRFLPLEKLANELHTMPFFKGFFTPDGFFGYAKAHNNKLVHLFNSNSAELIASEGSKGRGPNELLLAHALNYNPKTGSLFLHDIIKSSVVQFRYKKDNIKIESHIDLRQRDKGCVTEELQAISDSLFVIRVNDIAPPYCGYLAIVNTHNEILDSLQIFQVEDSKVDHSKIRIINASMRLTPDRKNLIVCNSKYNHLTKYRLENNSLKKQLSRIVLEPKYTVKKRRIQRSGKHLEWGGNVFTSDKYIYVVSNPESRESYLERVDRAKKTGEAMSEFIDNSYILVFDYDFNLINSYKTDAQFKWITIAPDEKTIYASTYGDGCYLTKYHLIGLK